MIREDVVTQNQINQIWSVSDLEYLGVAWDDIPLTAQLNDVEIIYKIHSEVDSI